MPRQRTNYFRKTYSFPDDFPERLKLLKDESGLTWSEVARRIWQTMRTLNAPPLMLLARSNGSTRSP